MREIRLFFQQVLIILLYSGFMACGQTDPPAEKTAGSLQGVWRYLEDDVLGEVSGMSFFTRRHFAFIVHFSDASSDSGKNLLAHSGTYSMQDSIVTATIMYSLNPAYTGRQIRWIHEARDSLAVYKVIDHAGNIVETGIVKRLE